MPENPPSSGLATIAVAILLALPLLYVTSYFSLSEARRSPAPQGGLVLIRVYPADRIAQLFGPTTKLESWTTGEKVLAGSRGQ
jgi:hypothetical protein